MKTTTRRDSEMRKVAIVGILLILSGCAHQDEWTTGDTVLQSIYITTALADAYATTQIHKHPNIVEIGPIAAPILGLNPDPQEIWLYFGGNIILHWLVARALPRGWRSAWQTVGIWNHGMLVHDANQLGLFGEPCTRHQEENPCP